MSNSPQSPDIGQNSDRDISDFQISGQSLIKKNYNSRTSDDIEVKLGPVTKIDKRNKTASKNLAMMSCWHCYFDIIVIFPIYGPFEAIEKPDSGCISL